MERKEMFYMAMNNEKLMALYNEIPVSEEVKVNKLHEIYDAIVNNDHTNIIDEMASRFNVSPFEWKIYRAISLRVIEKQLHIEGLS